MCVYVYIFIFIKLYVDRYRYHMLVQFIHININRLPLSFPDWVLVSGEEREGNKVGSGRINIEQLREREREKGDT